MAFSNIDPGLNLGKFLQIVFSDGLRNQISEDYRDWEYVSRLRYGNTAAREYRFLFQTAYGPAAIQYRNPGTSNRAFPAASQLTSSEHTALFKEINATIELEYNLWDRARKSPEKYAEPLAAEIQAKTTASKRRLAADFYADGTGVIGQIGAAAGSLAGNDVLFQLDTAGRGHVGFFEFGDILEALELDATASTLAVVGGTVAYWKVISKDRENNQVTLRALDSSFNEIVATGVTPSTAAEVFYRFGQPTKPDLTAITSSTDYGSLTEVVAGLESLAASDGRLIHGITMSGATGGTNVDAGGNPIDVKFIQKALSNVKIAVGADAYKWMLMAMAPETHDTLIESRETDRRFQTVEDNKRGVKFFAYVHGNDTLETYTSEYVPQNRIWMLPENKSNAGKVIEYIGSDFETVKGPNMSDFHLKATSAGYVNSVQSFLQGICVLVAKHPAAIASVSNFTNS
jgi:hypothetical protein